MARSTSTTDTKRRLAVAAEPVRGLGRGRGRSPDRSGAASPPWPGPVVRGVEILRAAGRVRAAHGTGDEGAARGWSAALSMLLRDRAAASGFAIWDVAAIETAQHRAGHDAWKTSRRIVLGDCEGAEPRVEDLLSLVAMFLASETTTSTAQAI
jgi:hypothetical protein